MRKNEGGNMNQNENRLGQISSPLAVLKYAAPSMVMMLFMGLYTVVDTIFVARFISTDALSSLNIVCPVVQLIVGMASMLATGGNAIIASRMGEGKREAACRAFSLLVITGALLGIIITMVGCLFLTPIVEALGATPRLFADASAYLLIQLLFAPANIMQVLYQNFLIAAGRPGLGFGLCMGAGITNAVLDYLLIVPAGMGVSGAALATGIGYMIPALAGCVYFYKNKGPLQFARPKWDGQMLGKSCANGASEMVGQLSAAITTYFFNGTMLRLAGEDGVAAITIVIYTQFLLSALFIGFSMGIAPVISFHYGGKAYAKLKSTVRSCLGWIFSASLMVYMVTALFAPQLVTIFAAPQTAVFQIAVPGFRIFALSFLFCGFNLFISALFTALSNGKVSALVSFFRTFGFLLPALLILPHFFSAAGVWMAVPAAEGFAALLSGTLFFALRRRYGYLEGI